MEFSLARQLPLASGLVDGCRELGIVLLAYAPLAMGRLSGTYGPYSPPAWWERNGYRARPFGQSLDEDLEAYEELLKKLREVGRKYGKSVAQVAINWVLCQAKRHQICIGSSTSICI